MRSKSMRHLLLVILAMAITAVAVCGCHASASSGNDNSISSELQGVTVTDDGDVAVTFRVPDGMTVEDVLGCEIGEEHTSALSNLGDASGGAGAGFMYWYEVGTGGIVTRYGDNSDVYRYSPTAETVSATGTKAPPAYVMLLEEPEENDILRQEDVEELSERYGVNLYFDGDAPNSNAKASGETYNAADFEFSEVHRFSPGFIDGVMMVTGDAKGTVQTDSSWFILSVDGTVVEAPCTSFSNFSDGSALAITSMQSNGYADSIIDKEGNVIWSIAEEGEAAAEEFFPEGEVTEISSSFDVEYDLSDGIGGETGDTYRGYFPVKFDIDNFDATGTCLGVLDSQGEWVVEPSSRIGYLREMDPCIAFEFDERQSNDSYGIVFDCLTGHLYECTDEEEFAQRRKEIESAAYLNEHDGLVYAHYSSDYLSDDFHPEVEGFYDASESLVIDLSSYNLADSPEFIDGYALLEIYNDQNSEYLTIVDSSGKQTLSPIKNTGHGELSEGKVFIENGEDGYFIDVKGNRVGGLTGSDSVAFSEGYAWIETDDGWKCIDEDGEIQFG